MKARARLELVADRLADAASVNVAVVSDTHLRQHAEANEILRRFPAQAIRYLQEADVILHAGDVVEAAILDELREWAPTYAVLGNNDRGLAGLLPVSRTLDLGGVQVAMVHDSGARAGRAGRMRRKFGDAEVVVFGHSHIPCDVRDGDGPLLFNPGSPTQRRSQPRHTMGSLRLAGGRVESHRIVPLD